MYIVDNILADTFIRFPSINVDQNEPSTTRDLSLVNKLFTDIV